MNRGGKSGASLELEAETWVRELIPELSSEEVARLGPDRDIIFEGLVEFLREERPEEVEMEVAEGEEGVAADAALLLPGARIHIRATPELGPTIKDAAKVAVTYVLGGDPATAGASLTIDLAYRIFARVTKLDEEELGMLMTLLDLRRGEGSPPTTDQLAAAVPDLEDAAGRLQTLAEQKVIREDSGGWVVNF